jgi:hypothetical protein
MSSTSHYLLLINVTVPFAETLAQKLGVRQNKNQRLFISQIMNDFL